MSLKMYFDAAATQQVLNAEKFPGDGSQVTLPLTAFFGTQLGGVYKETKVTHAGIAFTNGLGTGFTGLVTNELIGQRIIHGNEFVGAVVSNTETTVQVSTNHTGNALTTYAIAYKKLYAPTDFTLAGDVVTVVVPAATNEAIHLIPTDTLAMFFGGSVGTNVVKGSSIYLKSSTGFGYTALQVQSDDTSLTPYHTSSLGITFTNGHGTGFTGLPVGGLIGKAVSHNGVFVGIVTANDATTIDISSTGYNGTSSGAEIYNIGTLEFSLDNIVWAPVVHPADVTGATVLQVYFRDTVKIPAVAINYPSTSIKVAGIEFIA